MDQMLVHAGARRIFSEESDRFELMRQDVTFPLSAEVTGG